MKDPFLALGIAVAAGVLAIVLHTAARMLIERLLEKYGQKLFYAHIPDVSGEWRGTNHDQQGNTMEETVDIKQRGSNLSGTISYEITLLDSQERRHKVFELSGIIRNDVVTYYYHNTNRKEKGSGCICLCLSKDGDELRGRYAWWDVELERIASSKPDEHFVLTRLPGGN